jgi:PleD family two-component response regulator
MEGEGYHAVDVSGGEQCLSLCQKELPNIILLDAIMPGMDGFNCCSQLQKTFGDRCPPILMITTLHDQDSVDRAFAAGATDFITKPIHWAVLRQRVNRLLSANQSANQWQACLAREQSLKEQLESEIQKVKYLTELCQKHGIVEQIGTTPPVDTGSL